MSRLRKAAEVLWSIFVLALAAYCFVVMTGCAAIEETTGAAPYFDAGVGYQIDSQSDWHVQTDREWQCSDNYQGQFAIGLDWGAAELEYYHQSWFSCGKPFNSRPELYQDSINLRYRFGGK